jgi:hypothetical protein
LIRKFSARCRPETQYWRLFGMFQISKCLRSSSAANGKVGIGAWSAEQAIERLRKASEF